MTAYKVAYRLLPRDICAGNAMPWQEHHEARVERPLDDLDLNEFFQNVQSNLRVGDDVTICAFRDNKWDQLMEVGHCRIVSKRTESVGGQPRVRAVWVGEIYKVPAADVAPAPKPKDIGLTIKKQFAGGFHVLDEKGHIIETFKTKPEAEHYIDNLNEKPVEVAA